jgi:uncharacterized membrane protein
MTDQNPSSPSPYEPPGSGSTGPSEPSGYEAPATGSGFEPPTTGGTGGGSVYESSAYQPPGSGTPYGQPPAGGQMPPPYQATTGPVTTGGKNNTQLFGILGIVFAVVCCPLLGVLFGWLSMNEAKKTGSDDTLGKVGFWLGIAITAIGLIATIIAVCAGVFSANDTRY